MNSLRFHAIRECDIRQLSIWLVRGVVIGLSTWLIAVLFTVISVVFQILRVVLQIITKLSFKCIVYILLGTLFLCVAFILAVMSVITLGAISLP